tara:strand:+ start:2957 stop:3187 length:231 start_codon:yes stop_codon:yes gene_type:complete
MSCSRIVEAAHKEGGGIGKKGHDDEALPICLYHHRMGNNSEHEMGAKSFAKHIIERTGYTREELVEMHRKRYKDKI